MIGTIKHNLMSERYLIADTHFWHTNIIKYCNRPYANTFEMNDTLIKNWNHVVKHEDEVYVLGDFSFGNLAKITSCLACLFGRKYLILGNHDKYSPSEYIAAGFEWASPLPVVLDDVYILSHVPQNMQKTDRFVNIYGHVHDKDIFKTVTANSYCVSVERINYTPISFGVVKNAIINFNNGGDMVSM